MANHAGKWRSHDNFSNAGLQPGVEAWPRPITRSRNDGIGLDSVGATDDRKWIRIVGEDANHGKGTPTTGSNGWAGDLTMANHAGKWRSHDNFSNAGLQPGVEAWPRPINRSRNNGIGLDSVGATDDRKWIRIVGEDANHGNAGR